MYHDTTAARLEREIEELLTNGPFSNVYPQLVNSTPEFDMQRTSKEYGRFIGTHIAMAPLDERGAMIDDLMTMVKVNPQLDDLVVVMIRGMCVNLRHHLTDDKVAREFARLFAR